MASYQQSNNRGQQRNEPQKQVFKQLGKEDIKDVTFIEWPIEHIANGKRKRDVIIIPSSLIRLIVSEDGNLQATKAMKHLADYLNVNLEPLRERVEHGRGESPDLDFLSSAIREAYQAHAVLGATHEGTKKELFLNHPEVKKLIKQTAALIMGVKPEELEELGLDKTTVWVTRTMEEITQQVRVTMHDQTIYCERGSHREEKRISVPSGVTVDEARKRSEERLAREPDVGKSLANAFDKIEELKGERLSKEERNVIVAHLNITYLEDSRDRLLIAP